MSRGNAIPACVVHMMAETDGMASRPDIAGHCLHGGNTSDTLADSVGAESVGAEA